MPGYNKYHAKKVVVDGITFDSTKEALRWKKLSAIAKLGGIRNLRRQVPFELQPAFKWNGKTVRAIRYIADFVYEQPDRNGRKVLVVEDAKGFRTKEYELKKKLFLYRYGFEITEV